MKRDLGNFLDSVPFLVSKRYFKKYDCGMLVFPQLVPTADRGGGLCQTRALTNNSFPFRLGFLSNSIIFYSCKNGIV